MDELGLLEEGKRLQLEDLQYSKFEVSESDGLAKITGIISIADVVNRNNRLYPADVMQKAIDVVNAEIDRHPGLADHPEGAGSVADIAVRWEKFWMDDAKAVWGTGYIVPTAKGKDVEAAIRAGVSIGMSTRGWGEIKKVEKDGKKVSVITSFELGSVDFVLEPAQIDARVLNIEQEQDIDWESITKDDLVENRPDIVSTLETEILEKDMAEKEKDTRISELSAQVESLTVERDTSVTRVSELETQVESLTGELAEVKAKIEESEIKVTDSNTQLEEAKAQVEEVNTKLQEAEGKLTSLEAEKAAIAEDVENMKELINCIVKEIGEKAAKQDFYDISDLAYMGSIATWMAKSDIINTDSVKDLGNAVKDALSTIAVQNLHNYIREMAKGEKYCNPIVDALMSCKTKEEVDSKFDEVKARIESEMVSTKPPTKGEVKDKEDELSPHEKEIRDAVLAFREVN